MTAPNDVAFSAAVKAEQAKRGSRRQFERAAEARPMRSTVTPDLVAFLGELDHFYLGTASADRQPYIQHRGGPKGFLKATDERHLAFADFAGNRQYITLGNLAENPRAYMFLMHYPTQQRVKLWGTAEVIEDDPALLARLADASYRAKPERVIRFRIEAWDINCRQHITPRYTQEDINAAAVKMAQRIAELEAEVARLRAQNSGAMVENA
ncbi:MAG TPA: pyridoxamine 5'-phosphate oxidase family protein [Candidatus Cybelea sp.]|nr:pyridoxamine 5'-phosphate oxidase family protein [Candidatus Cybelea sp.]